jgi:hypothetical protein
MNYDSPDVEIFGWSQSFEVATGKGHQGSLQAKFPQAGTYTIQFRLQNVDTNKDYHAVAVVEFSVNGNTTRRIFTINNGTSITGVGEAVRVSVLDDLDASAGATKPQTYVCSVSVAIGARVNVQQPVVYNPLITVGGVTLAGSLVLAAASNATIEIPDDSGVISVFTTAGCAEKLGPPVIYTEAELQVQHRGTGVLKMYDPRLPVWVPIGNGASKLFFINASATAVRFSVAYGIDG